MTRRTVEASYRLFRCAHCWRIVQVCRSCDRGQRTCSVACGVPRRREQLQRAARRYQDSEKGRAANAERQRRWRTRKASGQQPEGRVTHRSPNSTASGPPAPQIGHDGAAKPSIVAQRSKRPLAPHRTSIGQCTLCLGDTGPFATYSLPKPGGGYPRSSREGRRSRASCPPTPSSGAKFPRQV